MSSRVKSQATGALRPEMSAAGIEGEPTRKVGALLKAAVGCIITATFVYFFWHEISGNRKAIQAFELRVDVFAILASIVAVGADYLLETYGWYLTVNTLSARKATFKESFVAVNASRLAKYIPGKVWSPTVQVYWLAGLGFSKSLILFSNLTNIGVSLAAYLLLGSGLSAIASGGVTASTIIVVVALLAVDIWLIESSRSVVGVCTNLAGRLLRREVGTYDLPKKLLYRLHAVHFLAALFFGAAVCLLCSSIGFHLDGAGIILVLSSAILSEVAGFAAFVSPGGLGVREGLLYATLKGLFVPAVFLIVPVAARLVSLTVDAVLGVTGIALARKMAWPVCRRGNDVPVHEDAPVVPMHQLLE